MRSRVRRSDMPDPCAAWRMPNSQQFFGSFLKKITERNKCCFLKKAAKTFFSLERDEINLNRGFPTRVEI
jgi:hypothetical protein